MTGRVCIVGSFITDLTVRTPKLPVAGETVIGSSFEIFAGGKGFNQAIAASRAGSATAMVGALGDDQFAELFHSLMRDEGVDVTGVQVLEDTGTGVGIPTIDDTGQNSIVIVPQANLLLSPEHVEACRSQISGADILVLQLEVPLETNIAAAMVAREAGTKVLLNPAPYQELPPELLELVDLFVPNALELGGLIGTQIDESEITADALQGARDALPHSDIIITLGDQGIIILPHGGQEARRISAHRVAAIDTVGAGDVFCGNLAAGISAGSDLIAAARRANAASAVAVTRKGSALAAPRPEEIDAFLDS